MKFIAGILIGILFSLCALVLIPLMKPLNIRDSAILIRVKNDTDNHIALVTLKSNDDQIFSCSLRNNICVIGILNSGDVDFTVNAELASGKILVSEIAYAEPGTDHTLLISQFKSGDN